MTAFAILSICLAAMLVGAIAAAVLRAYFRYVRPGTVADDIRADARRAISDTRRLLR